MGRRRVTFPPRMLITNATTPGDKIPASGWFRTGQENKASGGAELTHICWRALLDWDEGEIFPGFDEPRDCDVSYLVTNYFLWAAKTRFHGFAVAPCCGDWIPEPGQDNMSAGWVPGQHGEGCVDDPLRDPSVVFNATP